MHASLVAQQLPSHKRRRGRPLRQSNAHHAAGSRLPRGSGALPLRASVRGHSRSIERDSARFRVRASDWNSRSRVAETIEALRNQRSFRGSSGRICRSRRGRSGGCRPDRLSGGELRLVRCRGHAGYDQRPARRSAQAALYPAARFAADRCDFRGRRAAAVALCDARRRCGFGSCYAPRSSPDRSRIAWAIACRLASGCRSWMSIA